MTVRCPGVRPPIPVEAGTCRRPVPSSGGGKVPQTLLVPAPAGMDVRSGAPRESGRRSDAGGGELSRGRLPVMVILYRGDGRITAEPRPDPLAEAQS